jgi:predicted TIM-barrel fold metal-dependent hydrolase
MDWINSSDSHILEPEDLFENALGKKYADECPRYIDEHGGIKAKFYYTGYEYVRVDEIVEGDDSTPESAALMEEMIKASKDPYERIKCLDKDGIWAEILNSTWMLYTMRAPNDRMVRDCCEVYNDWIAEHCSADPKRLYGTSMVYMQDPEWAVKELERVHKLGLKSVLINCDTRPGWPLYHEPQYDKFWATAQDLDMPVTLHIITGNVKDLFTFHGDDRKYVPGETYKLLQECTWVLSNEFIFGGILDRFPKLKIACSEFEVSWLPYWLFRARQMKSALGPTMGIHVPDKEIDEYMPQIFHGMVDDSAWELCIGHVPMTNIAWGSDFPHARCTYPNSQKIVGDLFGHHDPKLMADLTYYNVANYYNMTLPETRAMAAE